FYPSIAANQNGDAVIGVSRADATRDAEAAYAGRLASDPPGTMAPPAVLKLGEDAYVKTFGSGTIRWGDYSATSVDPSDSTTFWTIQEYAATGVGPNASDDRWGTWWGRLQLGSALPSPPPTPTSILPHTATPPAHATPK